MLRVPAVQVSHPLAARFPPKVQKAICDGVVFKHDVVHMSVFLKQDGHKLIKVVVLCEPQKPSAGFSKRAESLTELCSDNTPVC